MPFYVGCSFLFSYFSHRDISSGSFLFRPPRSIFAEDAQFDIFLNKNLCWNPFLENTQKKCSHLMWRFSLRCACSKLCFFSYGASQYDSIYMKCCWMRSRNEVCVFTPSCYSAIRITTKRLWKENVSVIFKDRGRERDLCWWTCLLMRLSGKIVYNTSGSSALLCLLLELNE